MLTVFHEREFNRNRTVCENDVFCLNEKCVLTFSDLDRLCILEFRPSVDEFNTCILEQCFNTLVESIDDSIFPGNSICHLDFCRARDANAHMSAFLCMVCKFVEGVCCMNECFRRDASSNQTGSTCSLAFNNDGIHAKLTCTNCSNVSSRTCANDQNFAITSLHSNTSHEDGCWVLQHRLEQLNETCTIMAIHNTVIP